jgi:hypothetical protein
MHCAALSSFTMLAATTEAGAAVLAEARRAAEHRVAQDGSMLPVWVRA